MGKFTIETGIKPDPNHSAPGMPKYPWATMNVDDSFLVPVTNPDNIESLRVSLYSNGKAWFKRNRDIAVKFSIIKQKNGDLRVHRTE